MSKNSVCEMNKHFGEDAGQLIYREESATKFTKTKKVGDACAIGGEWRLVVVGVTADVTAGVTLGRAKRSPAGQ